MRNYSTKNNLLPLLSFILFISFLYIPNFNFKLSAEETIEEVEKKIDDRQNKITTLKKEIKESEKKLKAYKGKGKTLKSEIINLTYQEQKLIKNILEKEQVVTDLEKTIEELDNSIKKNLKEQEDRKKKIANSLIFINKFSNKNPLEILIIEKSLSKFSDTFNAIKRIHDDLKKEVDKLKRTEKDIKDIRERKGEENTRVLREKDILSDQKKIAEKNKNNRQILLKKTKNQEKYYQQLLVDKQKQLKQFHQEIYALESKLKILIDPASLPKAHRGLFGWPVPEKNLWITQYYGITPWRKKYANGTPHRGLDFGVIIGTPMYAISDGVVLATGDNDKTCKGAQYGKWIVVDQQNNLSSLYAHLSLIKVRPKQKVKKGDIIGYSGNTGYSTGPHLHFSIFATKGFQVQKIKHRWPGRCYQKIFRIPVVAGNAYLNPINYMPKK